MAQRSAAEGDLNEVYRAYCAYFTQAQQGCAASLEPCDFVGFMDFWDDLTPELKRQWRDNFAKGYDKVMHEADSDVWAAINNRMRQPTPSQH